MSSLSRARVTLVSLAAALTSVVVLPAQGSDSPISEKDGPEQWDAALFLPSSIPRDILKHVVGSSFSLNALPALKISVKGADIKFDYGKAQITIAFEVGTAETSGIAQLEASGTLIFSRFDRDPDGANPRATFEVTLDTLLPRSSGSRKLDLGNFAAVFANAGLLKDVADYLSFSVPVPLDLAANVELDDDVSFAAGKDGEVKVHLKMPGRSMSEKITGIGVVFVPSGLWVCSQFGVGQSVAALGANFSAGQQWKAYEESAAAKGAARLFVRGLFLTEAFNRFAENGALVTAKGSGHKNRLSDGDLSVWLANDSENATLNITPKAKWTSDDALRVECAYAGNGNADLGINLKLPIGSVGTPSVGCSVSSQGNVEASLVPILFPGKDKTLTGDYPRAAVLLPEFKTKSGLPEELVVHVETDGRFKTKLPFNAYLKTDAPKVQVDATLAVPPDILPQVAVLTNEPHPITYPAPRESGTLTPPKDGLPTHIVFEPTAANWDTEGYVIDFNVVLKKLTPEQAATQTKAIQDMLTEIRRDTLQMGQIRVTIAGIGPNNTLVQILAKFGGAVAVAYEEARRLGENVEATVAKAQADIEAEVARIPKNLQRAPRNIEREVGNFSATRLGVKGVRIPSSIRMPKASQLPGFIKKGWKPFKKPFG